MELRLVHDAFDDPAYIFELKHDGFRGLAYIENGECRLVSRRYRGLKFPTLAAALANLPAESAILDGEIVCLNEHGVSQFNQLLGRKAEPVFYAFDLLWLDGTDLRELPLIERKHQLAQLVRMSACPRLLYAQHIEANGKQFFQEICSRDLEGVVAKRSRSSYRASRSAWLKIKNRSYSQAEGRHELLTKRRHQTKQSLLTFASLSGKEAHTSVYLPQMRRHTVVYG